MGWNWKASGVGFYGGKDSIVDGGRCKLFMKFNS